MPFPDSGTVELSNKDIVSYTFDDPAHDIDKPVYIDARDPSRYYSHRTSKDLVQRLIAGLHAAGLQPGDTVCIHSFNSIVYPLLVLAIVGAGGLPIGTNPAYTQTELNHAIKIARVKFVLAEPEIMDSMVLALRENQIDVSKNLFVLDAQPDYIDKGSLQGLQSWTWLTQHGKQDWIRFDDEDKSTDTTAELFYTSGTTGLPKCAMTTHRNLMAQQQLFVDYQSPDIPFRTLLALPAFHIAFHAEFVVGCLKHGWDMYVMRRFELQNYLHYHAKYKLTNIMLVPPMLNAIVTSGLADPQSPHYKAEYSLAGIRAGYTGAAPLSGAMEKRFVQLLAPQALFGQTWGLTETTSVTTMVPHHLILRRAQGDISTWGSIGKPLPSISVKLVDESGNDTTHTGTGEICLKGPTIIKGYFHNPSATAQLFDAQGFLKTGDIARVDAHGLLYIIERTKELIKVRGFQVAPAELEGILTEHPDIQDAAVIGVSLANDEAPKAFIVKRPRARLTTAQIHAHMSARLAGYKQLTGGIEFVDTIPKLASGKILKRVLRDMHKKAGRENQSKL